MAKAAGCGATTLSQAAAGERLPALAAVEAYVRACGGDPAIWRARWEEARAEAEADRTQDEPRETDQAPSAGTGCLPTWELVCEHRFAVLFGPSGSGKSSLLRAGLVPRLREELARQASPAVLRILTPGPRPATTGRFGDGVHDMGKGPPAAQGGVRPEASGPTAGTRGKRAAVGRQVPLTGPPSVVDAGWSGLARPTFPCTALIGTPVRSRKSIGTEGFVPRAASNSLFLLPDITNCAFPKPFAKFERLVSAR
ncbi:hypothetical protein [Streptomyces sp. NBC_01530]|uniref:nSTAND1 domain-containing NTPase n=1 Tax=Streptomyces sp. NBC_01530 TaxID=2903895 RepID=UPI00386613C4